MGSGLWALIFLLLSFPARAAQAACPELFERLNGHSYDPAIWDYYAVPAEKKVELERIREATLAKQGWDDSAAINRSHRLKTFNRGWEVQLSQDSTKSTLAIFGRPYRESGTEFVDFQIWFHPQVKNEGSSVLRRMPYRDFERLAMPDFLKNLPEDPIVFLPKRAKDGKRSTSTYEMFRVKNPKISENGLFQLESISRPGRKKRVDAKELLYWNLDIAPSQYHFAQEFYGAGGKGDVVRLEHWGNPLESGLYLTLKQVPTQLSRDRHHSLLVDPELNQEVRRQVANGFPVILADDRHGYHASVLPQENRLNQSLRARAGYRNPEQPALVIAPTADSYVLKHEIVHLNDHKNGALEPLIASLNRMISLGKGRMTYEEAAPVYTFISEQRAYSTQLRELKADLVRKKTQWFRDPRTEQFVEIPYGEYLERSEREILQTMKDYGAPIEKVLTHLREKQPKIYLEVRELLRKFAFPSDSLGLKQLLRDHFRD